MSTRGTTGNKTIFKGHQKMQYLNVRVPEREKQDTNKKKGSIIRR